MQRFIRIDNLLKVVILAGGFGTRISEETKIKPKPMIKIGEMPIIWHIMKIYSSYNINEFVICCGYKGNVIKEYFSKYLSGNSNNIVNIENEKIKIHVDGDESWTVTLVDTGLDTMTGGRLKRVERYLEDETFCLTYGDDLKNVNMRDLVEFHHRKKKLVTITAAKAPPERFGILKLANDQVIEFKEKPSYNDKWINGGYYVLEPEVLDYIKDDSTIFEKEPLERLVKEGNVSAYKYTGLYHPLDTLQDKQYLEQLWNTDKAYWKVWK